MSNDFGGATIRGLQLTYLTLCWRDPSNDDNYSAVTLQVRKVQLQVLYISVIQVTLNPSMTTTKMTMVMMTDA